MTGKLARGLLFAVTAMFSQTAMAQTTPARFPNGPITIIVPYAAGGPPDIIARLLSPVMGEELGATVIVENRPGASTAIGSAQLARATPDGQTLMMVDPGLVVSPHMVAKPGYEVQKDFAWIAPLMRSYMGLVVRADFPAKSIAEFIAMAKAKPGDIKYGTSGLGTPPYLGALAFLQATNIDLTHVPYRGVALALSDVIAGNFSAVWMSQATAGPQTRSGLVRVLGTFGDQRIASLGGVPTFRETGVDTRVADQGTWFGMAAPAGTPRPIIERINAAVNKALRDPATREKLEKADFAGINGGTPEDLSAMIDQNVVYWGEVFAKAGVKPTE